MPTISVIVPVYKVEPYIRRCIDSILAQTYADFELILIDDGSPDNCGMICDEYAGKDSRIHVIHQENGGLSAARNAGIDWAFANSDSAWLTFIDSDDWVHPEYLERLLNAAVENDLSVSICGYAQTDGNEPEIDPEMLSPVVWDTEDFYVKHNVNAVIACGKLYRKECFEIIRYPLGKLHEDEFTTYKILFQYEHVVVIPAALYAYYINFSGITKSGITRFRIDWFTALEEQIEYLHQEKYDRALRSQICKYLLVLRDKLDWFKMNPDADAQFLCLIKRKWRKALIQYLPRLKPNDDLEGWTLTQLFPKTMWFYWHFKALLRKLRIIK